MAENLCEHLQPVLDYAIRHGNSVASIETTWERMKLVVRLEQPLGLAALRHDVSVPACVREWSFGGTPHYGSEQGLLCTIHSQSISWYK